VLQSRGLRITLAGAVIFLISVLALVVLPDGVPVFGMLAGGMLIWAGFMVTIFSYYLGAPKQPPEA
jgi:hypothetical protein